MQPSSCLQWESDMYGESTSYNLRCPGDAWLHVIDSIEDLHDRTALSLLVIVRTCVRPSYCLQSSSLLFISHFFFFVRLSFYPVYFDSLFLSVNILFFTFRTFMNNCTLNIYFQICWLVVELKDKNSIRNGAWTRVHNFRCYRSNYWAIQDKYQSMIELVSYN